MKREQFKEGGGWNAYLHSVCTDLLGERLHDIDSDFTDKSKSIVQILYLQAMMGKNFTKKKELANFVTTHTGVSVRENDTNSIIKMGFADEDLNPRLPKNLISLEELINLGKTQDEIKKCFTSQISPKSANYTINAAKMLKIIDENGNLIDIASKKEEIENEIIPQLKSSLPETNYRSYHADNRATNYEITFRFI